MDGKEEVDVDPEKKDVCTLLKYRVFLFLNPFETGLQGSYFTQDMGEGRILSDIKGISMG